MVLIIDIRIEYSDDYKELGRFIGSFMGDVAGVYDLKLKIVRITTSNSNDLIHMFINNDESIIYVRSGKLYNVYNNKSIYIKTQKELFRLMLDFFRYIENNYSKYPIPIKDKKEIIDAYIAKLMVTLDVE